MNTNILRRRILLSLYYGFALALTRTPRQQFRIFKEFSKEWKGIKKQEIAKQIKALYRSKLIQFKTNPNGTLTAILTEKGKLKTLTYHFETMKIQKGSWDGKWRMVIFDIPEKKKVARNALRRKLRDLGFTELQKSAFVFPYECKNEIDFIVEFFSVKPYVRYDVLDFIDNELYLKNFFRLV